MSYKTQYNTRHSSGRYNQPGQFVSAGELVPGTRARPQSATGTATPPVQNQSQQQAPPQYTRRSTSGSASQQQSNHNVNSNLQTVDVEMMPVPPPPPSVKEEQDMTDAPARPHWMKPKIAGVTKKVSNKEKRRRQNANLRKLLTPKNALMVLNEMLPNEQLANQFKVEPAPVNNYNNQYYHSNNKGQHSFCADLTVNGQSYKGYGENKLMARNVAAEQAIRDLIIQKMNKVLCADGTGSSAGSTAGDEGDEDPLPMIQLASFALHKLFSEWEYEGHKVPQLKPSSNSMSEAGSESGPGGDGGGGGAAPPRPKSSKPKELPANAASMHPCMLLTYMRPALEYRELAVDGDRQQDRMFTLGVHIDGDTYIGKASNKKEARKQAAMSACQTLFGVVFDENPTANAPQVASA